MKRIPNVADNCFVNIDGRTYTIEIAEPACGNWHFHDEPHHDGTPGQPQHHHHDAKCGRRTALLIPVIPEYPEWSPNTLQGKPDLYRLRNARLTGTPEVVYYDDPAAIPQEPVET